MDNPLSGPFSSTDAVCPNLLWCRVSGFPDWLQAPAFLGKAILLSLLCWLLLSLVYWFSNMKREVYTFFVYSAIFGPLIVGFVAGGASLVYGILNGSPGFIVGGGVVMVLSLIALVTLGIIMPHNFALPIVWIVIGLSLFYYGIQYSSPIAEAVGGGVAVSGFAGILGIVTPRFRWDRIRSFWSVLVIAVVGAAVYYYGVQWSSSSSDQSEMIGIGIIVLGPSFWLLVTLLLKTGAVRAAQKDIAQARVKK